MICEICGREFGGNGFKIIVEGAELKVCPNCKKFGTAPNVKRKVPQGGAPPGFGPASKPKTSGPRRPKDRSLELVEDYNVLVKNRREEMGLSQSDLGKLVNEKESLIHRIETKNIRPSTKVAKKLEKALDLKLLESIEDVDVESKRSLNQGLTIGDIIKFKK
ncbi:MAG TPA: multiprotein bridging factor aMBF1 [Candidatus Methanofastidiosa archaeon]|nr:multiprotein bridging factor aMBF1 [Candidatus Methanofastidiosa archaeon]HPR41397.1 multiprotein bridging factor aMBF1 [Candidatus Methanofastidiosa archaeon]